VAKEHFNHFYREPFSSFMEQEETTVVYAVGIGVHPIELTCLALQYNFCTSQGIATDYEGQGLCSDGKIPGHGIFAHNGIENSEEVPDTRMVLNWIDLSNKALHTH
jgi:hypothetical protein